MVCPGFPDTEETTKRGRSHAADCNEIEQYAHDAIQMNFADELRQGRLVWRVLNFEQPENLQQEVWGFVKANDRAGFATCVEEEVRAVLANQPFARNPE